MRLIHLSDLHLGKRVNEFSMIEDQQYILTKIINMIDEEKPDGVIIAGDIYDKSVPNEEAVKLLNDFLMRLAKRKLQVYIISGNHDSAVKLSFASGLIDLSGIHFAPVYDGNIVSFSLGSGAEKVKIYMLPFIKPATVRTIFPEEKTDDYTDAVRVAISHMEIDEKACNILVAHQFVTGATRSESEEISIGGLDNVNASVFEPFAYVALGHIHGPQHIGRETVRYCGTPLKYSFSEVNHHKSVTIVDIVTEAEEQPVTIHTGEMMSQQVTIRTRELIPLHDMRIIKGTYEELTNRCNYENTSVDDYLQIVLTDEEDIPDAMGKLRVIYPNLMLLKYDNKRTRENRGITDAVDVENKSPLTLFEEFYEMQNNQKMSEIQHDFVKKLMDSIWKGDRL